MEKGLGKNKEDFRGMKRTVVEKEMELKEKTKEAVKCGGAQGAIPNMGLIND